MKTFDDPKLTAYALGELDEIESTEIEAQLAADPEARASVEETRAFAAQLETALKIDAAPDLTDAQKKEIGLQASKKIVSFPSRWLRSAAVIGSIAACVAVGAFYALSPVFLNQTRLRPETKSSPGPQIDLAQLPKEAATPIPQKTEPPQPAEIPASAPTKVAETKSLFNEAESFYQTGRYDLAFKRYEQILNLDPYSIAARKGQEKVSAARDTQTAMAYNDTRSSMIWQVDKTWDRPVRRFDSPSVNKMPVKKGVDLLASGKATTKSGKRAESSITASTSNLPAEKKPESVSYPYASAPAAPHAGYFAMTDLPPGTEIKDPVTGKIHIVDEPTTDAPTGLSTDGFNTEAYDHVADNPFLRAMQNPLSTFSIDVDTASYANVRRFLNSNALPPKAAARIEELVNYFTYDYPQPAGEDPFSVNIEVAPAPWNKAHKLARIGLKGREIPAAERQPCNLVFLLDVSGSMNEPNKLPLVQQSMKMLVERLRPNDRVAIVVYAGASGMALPSTDAGKKSEILKAIDQLRAGGSTNGASGIQLAYDIAKANFIKGSANRVILCTDGDFNVGVTNQGDLVRLIEEKAKSGVFLTVLGFGMGNYKDSMLEKLADKGNGAYGYIDTEREAQKLFVDQLSGTLVTIAKDVKIQIEFNPAQVGAYRLIGYENRLLRAEDFNDDRKDAGEIGAGHAVTALYELVPAGHENDLPGVDPLKYAKPSATPAPNGSNEWMTVKLRYKQPDGDTSKLIESTVTPPAESPVSRDFQFAAAVAEFGMLLRESQHKGSSSFDAALELAENGMGADTQGYRHEFIDLVRKAKSLQ